MTTVDNRIVHMTFDNKEFERGISQSMASMEKMKASLNFSGVKDTFSDISKSASGVNLGGMAAGIDNISSKFSAMGAVAFSVISNITNRVVDAGINMAKKFAIGPITDGFQEMETNMNSIQTILANTDSKGSTLEDVNSALDQLNTYSDQTIYNFSQMARNIGTFTAAGVDLDTSVGAIKGIANLAAISGSNAEQASSAMYQLSQALASGSVKLMDWNSIVNAGMGGEVFQKALFETGKSLGTIADTPIDQTFDQWKEAGNSFRGSLEDGWLTAEVLTNTLQGFTGDLDAAQLVALGYTEEQAKEMMRLGALGKSAATEVKTLTQLLGTVKESVGSGWSKSFQIIFGDFEEAKSLFTGINTAIGGFVAKQSDARNALLKGWKDLGGRTLLIESLKNAFKGLATIIKPIKEAFQDIFPPLTAQILFDLTKRFSEFTDRIAISGLTALRLKVIFKGVFSAVQIIIEIVRQAATMFKTLYDSLVPDDSAGGILNFFEDIMVHVIDLKKALVDEGGIADFFEKMTYYIQNPMKAIERLQEVFWELVGGIRGAIDEILNIFLRGDFTGVGPWEEDSPVVSALFNFKELVSGIVQSVGESIDKFVGWIGDIFGADIKIPDGIMEFFQSFGDNIGDNTSNSTDFAGGLDRISTALGFVWDGAKKVWDVLTNMGDAIKWVWEQFDGFGSFLGDMFGKIYDFAKDIGPNLQKAFMSDEFGRFIDFLDSVGVLLGGAGIGKIAKDGLQVDLTGGALPKLGDLFKNLSSTIPGVKKNIESLTGVFSAMQTELKASALMKIAIAIGILTASMVVLSFIDPEALAKSLAALTVGFGQLIGAMALLDKIGGGVGGGGKLAVLAGGMILLSTAVLVLAGAIAILAQLSWEELSRGLAAISAILLGMVGFAKLMEDNKAALASAGLGMMGIGVALNFIASAVLIFSTMSWEEMGKGMAGVAASLILIAGAVKIMPAKIAVIAPSLVAVGLALNLIASAMLIFATMSLKEIGKGVLAIAGALLVIGFAMGKMPLTMPATAGALVLVGIALNALAAALILMGSMNMKEIGKAILVLTASLLVISAAMQSMMFAQPGAIALGIVAVSLLLLSKALKEFGGMKLKDLAKGLLGIVAVLAVLALSAVAMQPAIGAMIALGVALGLLGAGFALFGVGAYLVAAAFEIIATAGTAGIAVLMYAIDQILIRLPEMATQFAASLILFAQMILDAAPKLIEGIGKLLGALLDQIILLVPKVRDAAIAYIDALLTVFIESVPKLVAAGFALIMGLLHGIEDNIREIASTVASIIIELVRGLTDRTQDLVDAGLALLVAFLTGIADNIQDVVEAGVDILENLLIGIAQNIDDIVDAVGDIITRFIDEIGELYGDIAQAGTDALIEFVGGLAEDVWQIAHSVGLMVTNIMNAIADEFVAAADRAARIIIDFLNDLAAVIRKNDDKLSDAFANLGSAIIEGMIVGIVASVPKLIKKIGEISRDAVAEAAKFWEWGSPSGLMMRLGNDIVEGMIVGIDGNSRNLNKTIFDVSNDAGKSFQKAISDAALQVESMPEFVPTITPVLDLTGVKSTAGQLNGMLNDNTLGAQVSLDQARVISTNTNGINEDTTSDTNTTGPKEVKFEQNIYSPTQLNTAAIYRQSRNQIELAKKELAIP